MRVKQRNCLKGIISGYQNLTGDDKALDFILGLLTDKQIKDTIIQLSFIGDSEEFETAKEENDYAEIFKGDDFLC